MTTDPLSFLVGFGRLYEHKENENGATADLGLMPGVDIDEAPVAQPYGFSSHPHPESELVTLALGGEMTQICVIMAHDLRGRPALAQGDVAIHTDQPGHKMLMRRADRALRIEVERLEIVAGGVTITAAGGALEINAPGAVRINGATIDLNGGG